MRLPKQVKQWIEQFIREGESTRSSVYHAIDRAFVAGFISESQAEKLESNIEEIVSRFESQPA